MKTLQKVLWWMWLSIDPVWALESTHTKEELSEMGVKFDA